MSRVWGMLCLLSVAVWCPAGLGASSPRCHLPPPDAKNQESPQIRLETYDTYEACNQDNKRRFSGLGRCHCSFGNLPGAGLPPMEKNYPMGPGDNWNGEMR